MTLHGSLAVRIQSIRRLKLVYSIAYCKCCILIAYFHLLRYSGDYTQVLDGKRLATSTLNEISDNRGISEANKVYSNDRINLEKLVADSGAIYESEVSNANLTNQQSEQKFFNSAGEFMESVEDSRGSVWIIHIIMDNSEHTQPCSKSKFFSHETWKELRAYSKFFQMGTFNCARDPFFCSLKGWTTPRLMLGIVKQNQLGYSRDVVELFYYSDCLFNKFEHINQWLEATLRQHLLQPYAKLDPNKAVESSEASNLKIFYKQTNNFSQQIPLFFSAISLKYTGHAKFYYLQSTDTLAARSSLNKFAQQLDQTATTTPIFLIIDDRICYNFGTNLNELPNYTHLNLFLIFLYPDVNSIFLGSFLVLNAYLIMLFFEYNQSFLRQLGRGLFYLCTSNFVLFAIWLVQNTSSDVNKPLLFVNAWLNNLFSWYRFFMMHNHVTQTFIAHIRFVFFYHIYIQPFAAAWFYSLFLVLYYWHTRWSYCQHHFDDLFNSKTVVKQRPSKEYANTNALNSITSSLLSITSVPPSASHPLPLDSPDMEISVHELINQINGPTSIWLQSSTHADRFLLELPHIEYCKCFFANTIKMHACDETDIDTDHGTENEEEDSERVCDCGRNRELNEYFGHTYDLRKFRRECSICLDKYGYNCVMVMLPCGHAFHRQCIYEWFMNSVNYNLTCPNCRTSFYKLNKKII